MNCKKLLKYEIAGIFIIFFLGVLWHQLYDILGQNFIVGLISPVNESMWEHWKIGFFPIIIYSIIECLFVKDEVRKFLFSKLITILVFELVCFSLTAIWHYLFKDSPETLNLIVDIALYFIGIVFGQIAGYYTACKANENKLLSYVAILGILIHIIVFIIFTINPPKYDYFKDGTTGKYGVFKTEF